ncbi:trypsin-like serine protease [Rhodopseudomonas sp. AAP120]|uniref:trypsin-like serine protease n=1 Tax=Rhodopseudomonas sp. AAP120 TaxID=1523430 RepID=UPI0009E6D488|nr:trypsin-like serine protease [Rhodopseudomonas sp. AAP120]
MSKSVTSHDLLSVRVARARISAFLAQTGFMPLDQVGVRLNEDFDAKDVIERLGDVGGPPLLTQERNANSLAQSKTPGDTNGILWIPVDRLTFGNAEKEAAIQLKDRFKNCICAASAGLSLGSTGIVEVSVNTDKATPTKPDILRHILANIAKQDIRVVSGQLARIHSINDRDIKEAKNWIRRSHGRMKPGIQIETLRRKSTLTWTFGQDGRRWCIGAGHALERDERVYQPTSSFDERSIGQVKFTTFASGHRSRLHVDAAIIELEQRWDIADEILEREMATDIWKGELSTGDEVFFLGAGTQGLSKARVGTVETEAPVLTSENKIIYYQDHISLYRTDENPVSRNGDSGGPVFVLADGGARVCGMIVAGGDRKAGTRKPVSYCTPIKFVITFAQDCLRKGSWG